MDEPRRSGLQQARQDRGWTQEEAADQLARLAWMRRGERVGTVALARRMKASPSTVPDQTASASSANVVVSRCRGSMSVASS